MKKNDVDDKLNCDIYQHIFSYLIDSPKDMKNNKKDRTSSSYRDNFNFWIGRYYDQECYLHKYCTKGSLETVKELLKFGLDVNIKNKNRDTPLHSVCNKIIKQKNIKYFNILNIINILIDKGADINAIDERGRTPMHLVCNTGFLDGATALLKNGANMNIYAPTKQSYGDSNCRTPFYYACIGGHLEMVNMLLERIPTKDINLVIMIKHSIHIVYKDLEKIAIALINKIKDVNLTDDMNNTSLHWACLNNRTEVINVLLEKKANINARNNEGKTPMYIACERGHSDVFKILLDKGADVHITDKWGNNPLHNACTIKDNEIVGTLLKSDININAKNINGETPLHSFFNDYDRQFRRNVSEKKEILIMLLSHIEVDVNTINNDGDTPLHYACERDEHDEIVKILLDKGANVYAKNNKGNTPLHQACKIKNDHFKTIDILLKYKSDINSKNNVGNTPLHSFFSSMCSVIESKKQQEKEILIMLLSHKKVDVNIKNNHGCTPLHYASNTEEYHNNYDIINEWVKMLLAKGADINIEDNDLHNAIYYATDNGNTNLVIILG